MAKKFIGNLEARYSDGTGTKKHTFEGETAGQVFKKLKAFENFYCGVPACYFIATDLNEVK